MLIPGIVANGKKSLLLGLTSSLGNLYHETSALADVWENGATKSDSDLHNGERHGTVVPYTCCNDLAFELHPTACDVPDSGKTDSVPLGHATDFLEGCPTA